MKIKNEMKGRSLLRISDLSEEELDYLLNMSDFLKQRKKEGCRGNLLYRKSIALIFEKSSTRTRSAFAVAAADEGAVTEYLGGKEMHFGKKESVKDSARVLGRMYDAIQFRGYSQRTAEMLAECSGVPVWNGLTDESHPTQALADLMTAREYFGALKGLKIAYVGDGRNNVCYSLMMGCAKAGVDFVDCTPRELEPDPARVEEARRTAGRNGCSVEISNDPVLGVAGANVIYTDVWVSMGEESKFDERVKLLKPYQVNMEMMRNTGNLDSGRVIFLHCLPAFHDYDTEVTRETGALEVSDEVFESGFSKVFDLAENRLHTIKALMVATLSDMEGEI